MSIDDAQDVIVWIIDTNWDLSDYAPKPVIESMYKNRAITHQFSNYVRCYELAEQVEVASICADFEHERYSVTVDLQCKSDDDLELVYQATRNALALSIADPNPTGYSKYDELYISDFENLSSTNIYHGVIETELLIRDEYVG